MDLAHKEYYLTQKTIEQGHFDNLVMQDDLCKVWVSRCEEGEDNKPLVSIEHLINGAWQVTDTK
jgi:hypothetical protein